MIFLKKQHEQPLILCLRGTRDEFPDVKIILSHAGGTLPFLGQRISMIGHMPSLQCPLTSQQILNHFRSFYYDLALSSSVPQLQALLEFGDPTKIVFGSDIPYAPLPAILQFTKHLDDFFINNKPDQQLYQSINRDNAKSLFPDKVKE